MPRKIIFTNPLSPGDVVVSSALIRDLHRCYPKQFITDYTGTVESYFWNAPHITKLPPNDPEAEKWRMSYDYIHKSNQERMHFLYGYYHDFNKKFGLDVKMTEFRPDIHFDKHELETPIVSGRYWVIASGGKRDFVTKWWDTRRWQDVVDALRGKVSFVQVGELNHCHPPLSGTIDLRGKTSFRDLCRLILHSDGVCCVITCLMHIAAACNRPCVVVAGGREAWWWEAYTRKNRDANMRTIHGDSWQPPASDAMIDHAFLHTVGKYNLDCCASGGCWKSKVTEGKPDTCCKYVLQGPTILQPKCLMHITPEMVTKCVNFYRDEGYCDRQVLVSADTKTIVTTPKAPATTAVEDVRGGLDQDLMNPPVTICTLIYGPYIDLHRRNLESIVLSTDPKLYRLRVGMNELCRESREMVTALFKKHPEVQVKLYDSHENIKKYPMMRRMFHDPVSPLDTRWTIWFDDDSHIVQPDWLVRMSHCMRENYARGYNMYGKRYFFHPSSSQVEWIQQATWYRQVPFDIHEGVNNKTGKPFKKVRIHFATGGFWAIESDWLKEWDWPDIRISHNGGDVMMGEAIRQTGGNVKNWEYGVKISDAKRRGFSEKPAGAK